VPHPVAFLRAVTGAGAKIKKITKKETDLKL